MNTRYFRPGKIHVTCIIGENPNLPWVEPQIKPIDNKKALIIPILTPVIFSACLGHIMISIFATVITD